MKGRVSVPEHAGGTLSVQHGRRRLARYEADTSEPAALVAEYAECAAATLQGLPCRPASPTFAALAPSNDTAPSAA